MWILFHCAESSKLSDADSISSFSSLGSKSDANHQLDQENNLSRKISLKRDEPICKNCHSILRRTPSIQNMASEVIAKTRPHILNFSSFLVKLFSWIQILMLTVSLASQDRPVLSFDQPETVTLFFGFLACELVAHTTLLLEVFRMMRLFSTARLTKNRLESKLMTEFVGFILLIIKLLISPLLLICMEEPLSYGLFCLFLVHGVFKFFSSIETEDFRNAWISKNSSLSFKKH